MTDPQISPISQLLHTLGITREDLEKRSDQMRQFLTTEDANSSRVTDHDNAHKSSSSSDPWPIPTNLTSLSVRSRSRASSYSFRDMTPPTTPVKPEPTETTVPPRHFDSMEMVIERQRRNSRREKKNRREKEREMAAKTIAPQPQPPSPSPSNASHSSFNLDSFMQLRDGRRVISTEVEDVASSAIVQREKPAPPPITPQRSKYYRDHTMLSGSGHSLSRKEESEKAESPTRTNARTPSPQSQTQPYRYAYPQYLTYPRLLPPLPFVNAPASSSVLPVTPQPQRTYTSQRHSARSPLPPSSPPPASSPLSSPNRRVFNVVSSPGPMGPLPDEEEYDSLPYVLPPGPYSSNKPDLSYAALVGQAILSSPEHRLTLQEIYDWITIVYPHFKRGETTWMNSIRHVLSTTVCFRKVVRDRSAGRTLWAIWDEDLECFAGGGFRKQLCKDIMNGVAAKEKQAAASKTKPKARKRVEGDDAMPEARRAKRSKKDYPESTRIPPDAPAQPSYFLRPTIAPHTLFPITRPTPHHQPYYESCLPQPQLLSSDIIFPPLPANVGYVRVAAAVSMLTPAASKPTPSSQAAGNGTACEASSNATASHVQPRAAPSSESLPSVPGLTPSRSSSSPPLSLLATSEIGGDTGEVRSIPKLDDMSASVTVIDLNGNSDITVDDGGEKDDANVFDDSFFGRVKFRGESQKSAKGGMRSGAKLNFNSISEDETDNQLLLTPSKIGKRTEKGKSKRVPFPPMPTSPTLNRKSISSKALKAPKNTSTNSRQDAEFGTAAPPSTPPRNSRQLPVSSIRTPLSPQMQLSKKLSLSHDAAGDKGQDAKGDPNRTPSKRPSDSGPPPPVTPRRLVFSTNQNDSPHRTPLGILGASPFRTPGSRGIFDPHDPGALLDEELSRMGAAGHGESPAGLFGKGMGSLLYDSPGLDSPGKWHRWW